MLEMAPACVAWRRGWKAPALIPVGLALVFGFVLGAGAPHSETQLRPPDGGLDRERCAGRHVPGAAEPPIEVVKTSH